MKRIIVLLSLLTVVVPLQAARPRQTNPNGVTQMKLATPAPKGTSFHLALQQMAQQWRSAPDGGVSLKIYTDSTMGSETDMVKRMRAGQIDAALLTVGGLQEIDPGVTALQEMPMMFADLNEVEYVCQKLQPMLAERMRRKGFVVLFWADAGWVRFFSRKPALTPADLRKEKIFTVATANRQVDLMKALGYQPVPLEFADAMTSLKTGMIDVVPTAPFHALAGQYYTVANHMLELNWVPLVGALVITSEKWDALTPAKRDALLKAAAQAGAQIQARGRSESEQSVAAMKKHGLAVHSLTPATRAEWERVARAAYPRIRGAMVPADLFDEVQRLLAERRRNGVGTR